MTTPYQLLKAEAKRLKLPKIYETDLTIHDRQFLRPRQGQPRQFVWILRSHGTFLWSEPYPYSIATLSTIYDPETYFYIYRETPVKLLAEVSRQEAINFLVHDCWAGSTCAKLAERRGWLKTPTGFHNYRSDVWLRPETMAKYLADSTFPNANGHAMPYPQIKGEI